MNSTGGFVVGYTTGGNYGDNDPDESGPTSVECSAYSNTGASTQSAFQPGPGAPVFSNPSNGQPAQPPYVLPSVALSPSGALASVWANPEAKYENEQELPGVFTAAFVDTDFTYSLPDGNAIDITGGVPVTFQVSITRIPGNTAPITIGFSPLPTGVTASVSGRQQRVSGRAHRHLQQR